MEDWWSGDWASSWITASSVVRYPTLPPLPLMTPRPQRHTHTHSTPSSPPAYRLPLLTPPRPLLCASPNSMGPQAVGGGTGVWDTVVGVGDSAAVGSARTEVSIFQRLFWPQTAGGENRIENGASASLHSIRRTDGGTDGRRDGRTDKTQAFGLIYIVRWQRFCRLCTLPLQV